MDRKIHQFELALPEPGIRRNDILEVWRWALGSVRTLPGHLEGNLYVRSDDYRSIHLITGWSSWSNLKRFVRSEQFGSILAATDFADSPPRFRSAVVDVLGFKYIEELRSSNNESEEQP